MSFPAAASQLLTCFPHHICFHPSHFFPNFNHTFPCIMSFSSSTSFPAWFRTVHIPGNWFWHFTAPPNPVYVKVTVSCKKTYSSFCICIWSQFIVAVITCLTVLQTVLLAPAAIFNSNSCTIWTRVLQKAVLLKNGDPFISLQVWSRERSNSYQLDVCLSILNIFVVMSFDRIKLGWNVMIEICSWLAGHGLDLFPWILRHRFRFMLPQ